MLTFSDGHICTLCNCRQYSWIFACQSSLLSSQGWLKCWIHVKVSRCHYGWDVIWLSCFRYSPVVVVVVVLNENDWEEKEEDYYPWHIQWDRWDSLRERSNKDFLLQTKRRSVNNNKKRSITKQIIDESGHFYIFSQKKSKRIFKTKAGENLNVNALCKHWGFVCALYTLITHRAAEDEWEMERWLQKIGKYIYSFEKRCAERINKLVNNILQQA